MTIRDHMPWVYGEIKAMAGKVGPIAYALVRRGLRGEADCFYAFEAGWVMGTPFAQSVPADVAALIVEFGANYLCMWPADVKEAGGGAD